MPHPTERPAAGTPIVDRPTERSSDPNPPDLATYRRIRAASERLTEPLAVEDYGIQSMPEASPAKWHLAHTTWFFETLVVRPHRPDYVGPEPRYEYLYNSYYNTIGEQFPRAQRGLISRPTVAEVHSYRRHVDDAVADLLDSGAGPVDPGLLALVAVGLHHEQQHQELLITDLKHGLSINPLRPVYREGAAAFDSTADGGAEERGWTAIPGGLHRIGHSGPGYAFDNETPRHRVHLEPFEIATRPVTNGEYLEFLRDGGYAKAELWLSEGWDAVRRLGWHSPLYWEEQDGAWVQYTLGGLREVDPAETLTHVSYFEADAFARWAGARLPTEAEWEVAADAHGRDGTFAGVERFHPAIARSDPAAPGGLLQMRGDVWEWTASPYGAYPGFRPPEGALGEYNAKFMCNQLVLRGGSCVTPRDHIRNTYRNFFPPEARWQFSGLRLARDGRTP